MQSKEFQRGLALVTMLTALFVAIPVALAEAEGTSNDTEQEGLGEEEEYKNGFIFGFSHVFHLLRDRGDPIGTALGDRENLAGFLLAFERVLHPHVSLTFANAFSFFPGSDIVEHEISDSYLGAYFS